VFTDARNSSLVSVKSGSYNCLCSLIYCETALEGRSPEQFVLDPSLFINNKRKRKSCYASVSVVRQYFVSNYLIQTTDKYLCCRLWETPLIGVALDERDRKREKLCGCVCVSVCVSVLRGACERGVMPRKLKVILNYKTKFIINEQ
jgi:hypothetical protein